MDTNTPGPAMDADDVRVKQAAERPRLVAVGTSVRLHTDDGPYKYLVYVIGGHAEPFAKAVNDAIAAYLADAGRAADGEIGRQGILSPEFVAAVRAGGPVQHDGDAVEALCDSHERMRAALAGLVEEAERFGRKKGFDVELGGSLYNARADLGGGAGRGMT